MKSKKELLEDAKEIATETIATTKEHIFIAFEYGKKLASYYKVDETIVLVGLYLMDSKLKEARIQNKKQEHTQMAVEFAKEFLKNYDITKVEYDKIINCIEAHHGKVPFQYQEAALRYPSYPPMQTKKRPPWQTAPHCIPHAPPVPRAPLP